MSRFFNRALPYAIVSLIALGFTASMSALAADDYGMQKKQADIVDTAVAAGQFNTLAAALEAADLVGTLKGEGPFTVFAPTDDAFAKLPEGTVEKLLKPENRDQLVAVLTYHVVPGKVMAADVVNLSKATTVNGSDIAIAVSDGSVRITPATSNDIAVEMQLGAAQGGFEVDGYAVRRPAPTGYFSILGAAPAFGAIDAFILTAPAAVTDFGMRDATSSGAFVTIGTPAWPGAAGDMSAGSLTGDQQCWAALDPSDSSLAGARTTVLCAGLEHRTRMPRNIHRVHLCNFRPEAHITRSIAL